MNTSTYRCPELADMIEQLIDDPAARPGGTVVISRVPPRSVVDVEPPEDDPAQ